MPILHIPEEHDLKVVSQKTSCEIFREQELGLKGVNQLPASTHPLFSSTHHQEDRSQTGETYADSRMSIFHISDKIRYEMFREQVLGLKGVNQLPASTHPLFSSTPGTLTLPHTHCYDTGSTKE